MKVGYARVSTEDQSLDMQIDALKKAGCEKWFTDVGISGAKTERPGLTSALTYMREGDTLVVWKLDRLGRSLIHLIHEVQALEKRGIGFTSLTEQIDTTTPGGRLIFHVFGALAEFERALIIERTKAGLVAARARGRKGGRTYVLTGKRLQRAQERYDRGDQVKEICEDMKIKRTTFYRYVQVEKKKQDSRSTTHIEKV